MRSTRSNSVVDIGFAKKRCNFKQCSKQKSCPNCRGCCRSDHPECCTCIPDMIEKEEPSRSRKRNKSKSDSLDVNLLVKDAIESDEVFGHNLWDGSWGNLAKFIGVGNSVPEIGTRKNLKDYSRGYLLTIKNFIVSLFGKICQILVGVSLQDFNEMFDSCILGCNKDTARDSVWPQELAKCYSNCSDGDRLEKICILSIFRKAGLTLDDTREIFKSYGVASSALPGETRWKQAGIYSRDRAALLEDIGSYNAGSR